MTAALETFIALWSSNFHAPTSVTLEDLAGVEQRLGFRFPNDYINAVVVHGLPSTTIALLDCIVDQELELHDISEFHSAEEIVDSTIGWREAGMPEHLVAIANDCMGNQFCFRPETLQRERPDTSPIWFWDHDFDTSEVISPSFESWIRAYCQIKPT